MTGAATWLPHRRRVDTPEVRLVCFAHAGGSAREFAAWAPWLPPSWDLCPVERPGRGTRFSEPLIRDFNELLASTHEAVNALIEPRTILVGHSFGALVAFELARRHERAGGALAGLVLTGCPAPSEPESANAEPDWSDAALTEKLRELGGTPEEVLSDKELMRIVLPPVRADLMASHRHSVSRSPKLQTRLMVGAGRADREAPIHALQAWREFAAGDVEIRRYDGDHFFLPRAHPAFLADLVSFATRGSLPIEAEPRELSGLAIDAERG